MEISAIVLLCMLITSIGCIVMLCLALASKCDNETETIRGKEVDHTGREGRDGQYTIDQGRGRNPTDDSQRGSTRMDGLPFGGRTGGRRRD